LWRIDGLWAPNEKGAICCWMIQAAGSAMRKEVKRLLAKACAPCV
jgi:hypothetical protein